MPEVSVIMGIYNCADTLPYAIECILNQTFSDWELIMCDDGSTDGTLSVAEGFSAEYPDKIKVIKNEKNIGLNATLNKCIKKSSGKFIARMDGDDLCVPERFEKELAELKSDSGLALVSSSMLTFDGNGVWGTITLPEYPDKRDFLAGSPFCHAACIMRKDALESVGGYSEEERLLRVEDYHLWMKFYAAGYKGKNIAEPLYSMRDDRAAYKRRKFKYRLNEAYVRRLCVKNLRLPFYCYIYSLRPIIVGLLPERIYNMLHKRSLQGEKTE